jgi:hypothetical protein
MISINDVLSSLFGFYGLLSANILALYNVVDLTTLKQRCQLFTDAPPTDMTTMGEKLLDCVADTGAHMFKKKCHQSHRSGKVLRMWSNVIILNHITACLQADEQPPAALLRRRIYREATDQS